LGNIKSNLTALPILVVELPVPAGREAEWNSWYHDEHIPELLGLGCGAVRSVRYRHVSGEGSFRYLVVHEFASVEKLEAYRASPIIAARWEAYKHRWGIPVDPRVRAFEPIFEMS
jgi:hypothetical protein